MIESAHAVQLHGETIGSILQRGDVARFVFDEEYWSSPDRPVLGMWFEDNPGKSPKSALRLPPWFSNLLPEGRFREWVARERGVSADRELQLLLHMGADLPGAVQVIPDAGDRRHLSGVGAAVAQSPAPEVAGSSWKFSLAGVGMKFSMLRDGDRLTMPGTSAEGDWIVKLPDPMYPQVPLNEFGTMQLAKNVGIDVPEIELVHRDSLRDIPDSIWPLNETIAFAIRRFDRNRAAERVHIEDFAQVRGWYTSAKYDGSFETVAALAYRGHDAGSLREFVRRLTFNFLVGNGDAHLKNWSFIYPDRRIAELSPAYDLVSTGPYYSPANPDTTGLSFGGTRSFDRLERASFVRLQKRLQATDADVLDIVDATIYKFFDAWDAGPPSEMPTFVADWIGPHADQVRRKLGK